MIFAIPYGGLGNQLFSYAFARSIQEETGEKIYMSKKFFDWFYRKTPYAPFFFADYYFLPPSNSTILKNNFSLVLFFCFYGFVHFLFKYILQEKPENLSPKKFIQKTKWGIYYSKNEDCLISGIHDLSLQMPVKYVEGLYQWSDLLLPIRKQLQKDFTLKQSFQGNDKKILEQIKKTQSVCLHIRRGDYFNPKVLIWSNVCNYTYYKNAMDYIVNQLHDPIFFVFSDEIDWVKKNYNIPYKHIFIDENHAAPLELELMRNCKHFILSNSSFSWWAQFLAEYDSSVVVAPNPWLADGRKCSIYMKNWHMIDCYGGMDK